MSSMDQSIWAEIKSDPSYTALVGEFTNPLSEIAPRILNSERIEDVVRGNVGPVESTEEDEWNKALEICETVQTNGYSHIFMALSERVSRLRKDSSDSPETDKDKITAQHFKARGAKELLDYLIGYVDSYTEMEKPKSLL